MVYPCVYRIDTASSNYRPAICILALTVPQNIDTNGHSTQSRGYTVMRSAHMFPNESQVK